MFAALQSLLKHPSQTTTNLSRPPVTICAAGRGGSNCALCAVGAWSAGGTVTAPKRACSQCAAGMTTLAMGSKLAADCKGAREGPKGERSWMWGLSAARGVPRARVARLVVAFRRMSQRRRCAVAQRCADGLSLDS